MVQILFDPSLVDYDSFFKKFEQSGEGPRFFVGNRYTRGYNIQRGYGIANVLSALARLLIPVAAKAGKSIASEGFSVGNRILEDVSKGKDLSSSFKTHAKAGIGNLIKKQSGGKRVSRRLSRYSGRLVPNSIVSKRKRDIFE
jgi:hypothetical protein